MDHPGFVTIEVDGRSLRAEFRGGVLPAYFAGARVEFLCHGDTPARGRVTGYDPEKKVADILLDRARHGVDTGRLGRWAFPASRVGVSRGRLRAPACDDLAGVAAALAAFDRARRDTALGHFGVLLTRGEEEGLLGAIGAARHATVPAGSRVVSIETSRSFPDSPLAGGPVVRVGDASSVFSTDLTNRVSAIARVRRERHQRKLMAGGTCEATAFVAFGYEATGLCLPLDNYHNMADIDGVRAGTAPARTAPEEIDLADFDGLVRLLLRVARDLDGDGEGGPAASLAGLFEEKRGLLG
jgi:endoglucanase